MDAAISTRDLSKRFRSHPALRGLNLEVPRGVVFGYLGPNGAGKTTTIRILAGLIGPTSGTATVLGNDVVERCEEVQRRSSIAAATAAYVLYATGLMIESVEPWQPLSPFQQALTGGPLGAGLPAAYLWLVAGAAALVLIAMPALDDRDIAAHN